MAHGAMVSTLDSDSSDPSSNLGETYVRNLFLLFTYISCVVCFLYIKEYWPKSLFFTLFYLNINSANEL